jgi:hypothetical protein
MITGATAKTYENCKQLPTKDTSTYLYVEYTGVLVALINYFPIPFVQGFTTCILVDACEYKACPSSVGHSYMLHHPKSDGHAFKDPRNWLPMVIKVFRMYFEQQAEQSGDKLSLESIRFGSGSWTLLDIFGSYPQFWNGFNYFQYNDPSLAFPHYFGMTISAKFK